MPSPVKVTSPEQLNDYIHVTAPAAWLILSASLIFLTGFLFWIMSGRLEISFSSYAYTEKAETFAFIPPENASKLKKGMAVRILDTDLHGTVEKIADSVTPYREITELIGETNALMMGINGSDRLFRVDMNIENAPEKISHAVYVVDTVKPISFLLK